MHRHCCAVAFVVAASLAAFPVRSLAQQRTFATPQEALDSLVEAAANEDGLALVEIFGPDGRELVDSGDPVQDRRAVRRFADAAMEMARIVEEPGDPSVGQDDRYVIFVGQENWPFPVPLVRARGDEAGWRFDTETGKEELINRRIGRNELATIEIVRAYVDAQREYHEVDRDDDEVPEYATKFISDRGTHNGLYWPTDEGATQSPIGPLFARAAAEGYGPAARRDRAGPAPFQGYTFRILTGQGPDAPGGSYDYIINGNMVAGFGLLATPAQYGSSGIMTFIVGPGGTIYERDLGAETETLARDIQSFNPDRTWRRTDN